MLCEHKLRLNIVLRAGPDLRSVEPYLTFAQLWTETTPSFVHRAPRPRVRTSARQPVDSLMTQVTHNNYRNEGLFPRVERAVQKLLKSKPFVAPVDVFLAMDLLRTEKLEDWRRGRVPYLERVILGNLSRLERILRILGFYCHDLNLRPSPTVYVRHGGRRQPLRFTKTGNPRLEEVYSRHFVSSRKEPARKTKTKESRVDGERADAPPTRVNPTTDRVPEGADPESIPY